MKYYAYLEDEDHNLINKFWFRSEFNTIDMDKVLKRAEEIADENNYKYNHLFVGVKNN